MSQLDQILAADKREGETKPWPLADQRAYALNHSGKPRFGFTDETDIQIAGRVRMLMRDDWLHEAVCEAARDRICRLWVEREALAAAVRAAEPFLAGFEDDASQTGVADLLAQLREALAMVGEP